VTVLSARFAAEPASVPGARHFVTDGLRSWGLSHLIDDIALCVTELGANAALHSAAAFMSVTMTTKSAAVTISVEDDGEVVGAAVVPRADYSPDAEQPPHTLADEPTTGRGLAIVAALASHWGVHATDSGKTVWARFGEESGTTDGDHPAQEQPGVAPEMPEGWTTVRLADCPVRLSLRQDEHLDELVRELQLLQVDDDTRSRSIAQQIHGLLTAPAHARLTGRRIAQLADEAGLEHVDIDMALPAEASLMIRELHRAVLAADELCEDLQLLTLDSPPEMRALRIWMTEEIVAQIEEGRAPVSWRAWQRRADHGTAGRVR
jgi:anti-sigma regulatory factor (Ser/Thr protein kinase)